MDERYATHIGSTSCEMLTTDWYLNLVFNLPTQNLAWDFYFYFCLKNIKILFVDHTVVEGNSYPVIIVNFSVNFILFIVSWLS